MCNLEKECLEESSIDYNQLLNQADFVAMDSSNTSVSNNIANLGNDEATRVKFLCSFGGSILPRPQDGKLRYVGGETRIVSVPRDIGYEELMGRMRELYEGAAILKYQQPDEDLDALVSVVNDDDVINMMEEYDKLGSADGFTRLRIFLFSHPEHDVSPHYMDGDERETERRYVDALNSLCDSPEYRRQQLNDSPIMTPVDEVHIADQLFSSMNLEGSVHNQRNYEMGLAQYSLRQLAIPSMGSGQHMAPAPPRYNEEAPWSPAFYSPRCAGLQDTRTFTEFPSSPSSARCRIPFQEVPDKCVERMLDEPTLQQVNSQVLFDHQQQYTDNVAWLPTGGVPVDRGGFPGNILNGHSVLDGPNVCEHCKMTFQRNPVASDYHWKADSQCHMEQANVANGFPQVANHCVECLPKREPVMLNTDPKLQHSLPGVGRMGEYYNLDGSGASISMRPNNLPEGPLVPTTYAHLEDPRYIRAGAELGGEVFHGQAVPPGSHAHIPLEERGVHAPNLTYSYGTDIPHQGLRSHPSAQATWRNVPTPVHVPPVYDSSNLQLRNGVPSPVVPRANVEANPRVFVGVDQSPWGESSRRRLGAEGSAAPDYPYSQYSKLSAGVPLQEVHPIYPQDPLRSTPGMVSIPPMESMRPSELPSILMNENTLPSGARDHTSVQRDDTDNPGVWFGERSIHHELSETTNLRKAERPGADGFISIEQNNNTEKSSTVMSPNAIMSNGIKSARVIKDGTEQGEINNCLPTEKVDLSFLPELVASAKKAKLESAERVKAKAQEDGNPAILHDRPARVAETDETLADVDGNSEGGSENDNIDTSKIERTEAEDEVIAKGLQTIKNADLEEIRVLGSGTYGSVFHGKWKGSDVAIKRIKASCFAGRPSERERLIADFWKEAFLLSSLHHPNVVSFYGIVRDGPDGTLATVTEFMINGSLKQYLQKKDRTIDRRKRLIIAMDAAFGMEYLHGKNIVHFDLKCENLLVNMRDPHRPVCKIGDLGLSKVKQHTLVSGGVRGTLPWMAPELLSGKSNMVTEKIDVYSFGIVMWELLTGEEPYSDKHCASIIGGIVNNTLRPQIPTWCDPEWKSLMESCWAPEPAERPSFSEISQKLRSMAAAMNVK